VNASCEDHLEVVLVVVEEDFVPVDGDDVRVICFTAAVRDDDIEDDLASAEVDALASWARIDKMLEASAEPIVRVDGGSVNDVPVGSGTMTVTVFLESPALDVFAGDLVVVVTFLQPVIPCWAPVALMIDRASALLVQARNVPLDFTKGKAKHESDFPPEHFFVSQLPLFEHWAGSPVTQAVSVGLQESVVFKVKNSAFSACAAMPFCKRAFASSAVGADDTNGIIRKTEIQRELMICIRSWKDIPKG